MLHVCSGDHGREAWAAARLPGEAVVWRDSPAMGPWHPDPLLRSRSRARFWGLEAGEPMLREEEGVMAALRRAGGGVLWFSAEPWDQMAQLWVVARSLREAPSIYLELTHLREGGSLPPATREGAFAGRTQLAPEDGQEALRLWEWFEAKDWPALWKWLHRRGELGSLPFLARALARVLEDRPPHVPGRTERQVRDLQAAGIQELSPMMQALAELEVPYGLAWYGDRVVRGLMGRDPISLCSG